MLYIFDTSSFIVTGHYYPAIYPGFWNGINEYIAAGKIISVREVRNELDRGNPKDHLETWIAANSSVFTIPSTEELDFVAEL